MPKKIYMAPAMVQLNGQQNEYGAGILIVAAGVWVIGIGLMWVWG